MRWHSQRYTDLTSAMDKQGPSLRTPYGVMKCYLGCGEAETGGVHGSMTDSSM